MFHSTRQTRQVPTGHGTSFVTRVTRGHWDRVGIGDATKLETLELSLFHLVLLLVCCATGGQTCFQDLFHSAGDCCTPVALSWNMVLK